MKVINTTRRAVISEHLTVAGTFWARLAGLLNRKSLPQGEGLLIINCQAIHMFFMKFSIDAIFIDKNHSVVGLVENIKPFEMSSFFWKANGVIELPVGTIQKSRTEVGDVLEIK